MFLIDSKGLKLRSIKCNKYFDLFTLKMIKLDRNMSGWINQNIYHTWLILILNLNTISVTDQKW
jgi:hypothetical protein